MTADVIEGSQTTAPQTPPDEPTMSANETERMRRSVWVEVAIAAVVLAVTSVLVSQPRGNEAIGIRNRHPVSATADLGSGASAKVTINPGTHGPVEVEVTLTGVKPQTLAVTASEPGKQIGPIPVPVVASGAGQYTASEVDLPVSGGWVIQLVITTSKFNAVTADVKLGLH
jgi:copper transport protein